MVLAICCPFVSELAVVFCTILAPGWAETSFMETEGNNTSPANLEFLAKRQTCAAGYGYCSNIGGCCPASDRCCPYGYCLTPGRACCPGGSCPPGYNCCENSCAPIGSQCCRNGRYCNAGNVCVLYEGSIVCCTDYFCTANVVGTATIRATTARAATMTITRDTYQWYTYTVYWTYRYYYWYYIAAATASVVTYTSETITTTVTVHASNRIDASSSLAVITAGFTTPASATSLASLVGVTSTLATRIRATSTATGASGPGGTSVAHSVDLPAVCFIVGGFLVGVMAVWL